jgi:hypothetical protein
MEGIMEVTQTDKAITLDCGCNVGINLTFKGGEFVAVQGTLSLCTLHMAAPKLLAALEGGVALVKNINTVEGNDTDTSFGLNWLKEAHAVIKEATK